MMTREFRARPENHILTERDIAVRGVIDRGIELVTERYGPNSERPKPYHGPEHTDDVMNAVAQLADLAMQKNRISPQEKPLLLIAAAYHDVVHQIGSEMNKEMSANTATANMIGAGSFDSSDIKTVQDLIMATRLSVEDCVAGVLVAQAVTRGDYLTRLIADADLSYLGQPAKIFLDRYQKYHQEKEGSQELPQITPELAAENINFMLGHKFYTDEAKQLFPYKPRNIELLLDFAVRGIGAKPTS